MILESTICTGKKTVPSALESPVDGKFRWHQKSVGAGTTLGIDSFDTGKMDHPTGFDKLTAIWIDAGYNLALEVSPTSKLWCQMLMTSRIFSRRQLPLGKLLVQITMVKLRSTVLKMRLVKIGHSKLQEPSHLSITNAIQAPGIMIQNGKVSPSPVASRSIFTDIHRNIHYPSLQHRQSILQCSAWRSYHALQLRWRR
jgi:hypothetical protein